MSGIIYLVGEDDKLQPLQEQPYVNEDLLQALLEKYPQLLAGEQMDEAAPRRWLLIGREMRVPEEQGGSERLSLDHLFLDQDGVPTLVEVKRSSDTRIRREVVGQMLDYAANGIAYWPAGALRARFEADCTAAEREPEEEVRAFLDDRSGQEPDVEAFWQQVKLNLQAGRVRLVFVADEIPPQLRRIVEFLNEQMDPAEVLAVEVRQYVGKGIRTLVPRVLGQTAEAQQRKSAGGQPGRQWDEASFFTELAQQVGSAEVEAARRVLAWSKSYADFIYWGRGVQRGTFVPNIKHEDLQHRLFVVWTTGWVELYFAYYMGKAPFDQVELRDELRRRLNRIAGVELGEEVLDRLPKIPLKVLTDEAGMTQFLETFEWMITVCTAP